jgi:hypothetical protein
VLHNLACANWWGVYNYVGREAETFTTPEYEAADNDFRDAVPKFIEAINQFEGVTNALTKDAAPLQSPMSGLCVTNIAEVFLQSKDIENCLQQLQISFDLYKRVDKSELARSYIILGILLKT